MKNGDFAARRRADFLRALEETANVMMAAAKVGVSKNWLYTQRTLDPGFASAWALALANAQEKLVAAGVTVPKRRLASLEGRPLVVFGSPGGKGLRVGRARANSWTAHKEARFLECMQATCNVRGCCGIVGVRATTAYQKRRDSAAFREAWDVAIEDGRRHVESAMIAAATNLLEGPDGEYPELAHDVTGMDAKIALGLLAFYQRRDEGRVQRNSWRLKSMTPEAARANLLRKLEAIRAAEGHSA